MGIGFAPTWLRQVSPLLHMTTLTTDQNNYKRQETMQPNVANANAVAPIQVQYMTTRSEETWGKNVQTEEFTYHGPAHPNEASTVHRLCTYGSSVPLGGPLEGLRSSSLTTKGSMLHLMGGSLVKPLASPLMPGPKLTTQNLRKTDE